MPSLPAEDRFFTSFISQVHTIPVPERLTFLSGGQPHPLCLLAAEELQSYLENQEDWEHNFGLNQEEQGVAIGKMFGVLVVQNRQQEIGYLAAFSGKLAGSNHHKRFVPPVFDTLTEDSFLTSGMIALGAINQKIRELEQMQPVLSREQIAQLKTERRQHSNALQHQLYDQYHFLNQAGKEKSLLAIFKEAAYKNPPAGAGECAAPKLLQYAFQQQLKPLAIAEFWWGVSPLSSQWRHGRYYPCCREKCAPILAHMLEGLDCEGL